MILYGGWRLLGPLARALPRSCAYAIADALMSGVLPLWPPARRAMRANLRHVLVSPAGAAPNSAARAPATLASATLASATLASATLASATLASATLDSATLDSATLDYWAGRQFRRYGEYLVDTLRLDATTPQACLDALHADPDDWDAVARAVAEGPVIFALLHAGNWDVAAGAFAARGWRAGVLIESLGHQGLDRWVQGQRAALGVEPVPLERPARALRLLREGAALGILFDRPLAPHEPGVDVHFCGAPCRVPSGMARLALATGARVIPLAVIREHPRAFAFRALVDLSIETRATGDRDADAQRLTQAVLDAHAPWVRRWPDQWYQFRPFFHR